MYMECNSIYKLSEAVLYGLAINANPKHAVFVSENPYRFCHLQSLTLSPTHHILDL